MNPDPADPRARPPRSSRQGGLVAFATETVYGLGADATNPEAVARIFAAKGRPAINPLIVHADGIGDGPHVRRRVARDGRSARRDAFWPGPLTLVLPRSSRDPRHRHRRPRHGRRPRPEARRSPGS